MTRLEPGAVLAGRYEVSRCVARGGFGEVYLGRHVTLDVPIAIKLLLPARFDGGDQATEVAAFLGEARLLARLRHPNIVSVLDAGTLDVAPVSSGRPPPSGVVGGTGLPWMVLSWCEGETLKDLRERGAVSAPMSSQQAWRLLRPAVMAVAYANGEGISHRDLKPSNLMRDRTTGELVVVDFGVAKSTRAVVSPGSPPTRAAFSRAYASPEQMFEGPTGPWTDVYQLALIFTELVTGVALEDVALGPGTAPSPAARDVVVEPALEAALARAMSLAPKDRHADAGALAADIDAALAVRPATATAPPPSSHVTLDRRMVLYAAAGVLTVVVLVAVLVARWAARPTPVAVAARGAASPTAAEAAHHASATVPISTAPRSLPSYALPRFRSVFTTAGFSVANDSDRTSGGIKLLSLSFSRGANTGTVQFYDYGTIANARSNAMVTSSYMRGQVGKTAAIVDDGARVLFVSCDQRGTPSGSCTNELLDALAPKKR